MQYIFTSSKKVMTVVAGDDKMSFKKSAPSRLNSNLILSSHGPQF
jgi:hypothetical protein